MADGGAELLAPPDPEYYFTVRVIYEAQTGDVMIVINLRRRQRKRPTADLCAGIWLRDPSRSSAGISTFTPPPPLQKRTFQEAKSNKTFGEEQNGGFAEMRQKSGAAAGRARRFRVILIFVN